MAGLWFRAPSKTSKKRVVPEYAADDFIGGLLTDDSAAG